MRTKLATMVIGSSIVIILCVRFLSPADYYNVVSVEDGDTLIVDMSGRHERVRFIGVDTPESHHPKVAGVQCYAVQATERLKELLTDQKVRLLADSKSTNRDRYDRLLRHVYDQKGRQLNLLLVREGYGFVVRSFRFSQLNEFVLAEDQARTDGRGLWSACEVSINKGGYYSTQITENR